MNRKQLQNHLKSQRKYYRTHHKRCLRIAMKGSTAWFIRHRATTEELNQFKNIINLRLNKSREVN